MLPPGSEIYRDMSDGELEMNIENIPMTDSCDVVRYVPCPIYHNFPSLPYCISGKSSFLIDNGEMKVGEFQKEIHVSSSAYSNFLRKSGAHQGEESDVYYAAWRFFKKREMKGIKTKQKLPTKEDKKKAEKVMPDVSRITLDGEEDDRVEVYGKSPC